MTGLFPLASGSRPFGEVWGKARRAAFWGHPQLPFRTPALAGPEATARRAVGAFLDWLRDRPRIASLDAGALPAASAAARLIAEEASARGLPVLRRRGPARTHGLNFRLRNRPPALERVRVTTETAPLHHALERLFCLDGAAASAQPVLTGDPREPALLRAVLRGFARQGKAAIAMIDDPVAGAGALALIGRDRAYLWRMMGPAAVDPAVEAALIMGLELRLGLPIVAATATPLAGVGAESGETESLEIGLSGESQKTLVRMRSWLASGILGL